MATPTFRWAAPAANDGPVPPCQPAAAGRPYQNLGSTLQWLLDEVMAETLGAMQRLPPGTERLWIGVEAHCNARLRRPAIQALAATLPAPERANQAQRCIDRLCELICRELMAAGVSAASSQALLLGAMTLETQREEQERRHPITEYRRSLRRHLRALAA